MALNSKNEPIGRRQCIPIIYTRGTHYQVGYDVGRTFSGLINDFLKIHKPLNEDYLPFYQTEEGKRIYDETLESVQERFPQYVDEIKGTADGADVPFYKLFLLHLDDLMVNATGDIRKKTDWGPEGCSSICANANGTAILGHNEDALAATLNYFYFVSAHIVCAEPQGHWGVQEERFTSLCYAGHLPGYTMSYNHHGLVYSINTLAAKRLYSGKTPRYFITRALLAAENLKQAEMIVLDEGIGAANGCSINMSFIQQNSDRVFHNLEMAPPAEPYLKESQLNIISANRGETLLHCNKYLRLKVEEISGNMMKSSLARMCALQAYKNPTSKKDVIEMLGDQSGIQFQVFQDLDDDNYAKTIAVGIFDCIEKTWSIYADNPKKTEPVVVLPLVLKNN